MPRQTILSTLTQLHIEHTLYEHERVFTVEQANKIEKNIPAFHTKNLFMKDKR